MVIILFSANNYCNVCVIFSCEATLDSAHVLHSDLLSVSKNIMSTLRVWGSLQSRVSMVVQGVKCSWQNDWPVWARFVPFVQTWH